MVPLAYLVGPGRHGVHRVELCRHVAGVSAGRIRLYVCAARIARGRRLPVGLAHSSRLHAGALAPLLDQRGRASPARPHRPAVGVARRIHRLQRRGQYDRHRIHGPPQPSHVGAGARDARGVSGDGDLRPLRPRRRGGRLDACADLRSLGVLLEDGGRGHLDRGPLLPRFRRDIDALRGESREGKRRGARHGDRIAPRRGPVHAANLGCHRSRPRDALLLTRDCLLRDRPTCRAAHGSRS